jgi:hypothetical protein
MLSRCENEVLPFAGLLHSGFGNGSLAFRDSLSVPSSTVKQDPLVDGTHKLSRKVIKQIPTYAEQQEGREKSQFPSWFTNHLRPVSSTFNPLNAELNPICHLLALLGAHHILHVSDIRANPVPQRARRTETRKVTCRSLKVFVSVYRNSLYDRSKH